MKTPINNTLNKVKTMYYIHTNKGKMKSTPTISNLFSEHHGIVGIYRRINFMDKALIKHKKEEDINRNIGTTTGNEYRTINYE